MRESETYKSIAKLNRSAREELTRDRRGQSTVCMYLRVHFRCLQQYAHSRALGRDQKPSEPSPTCEGSALRVPPPPFFPLITSAIMKAPYYYQLALWLVGSGNERTNERTLRYRECFFCRYQREEADRPSVRSIARSRSNVDLFRHLDSQASASAQ